jgi:hypothetical protein
LDGIEFLVLGDTVELVTKKFHGPHTAHPETLD